MKPKPSRSGSSQITHAPRSGKAANALVDGSQSQRKRNMRAVLDSLDVMFPQRSPFPRLLSPPLHVLVPW